jgi:hypothetical protein
MVALAAGPALGLALGLLVGLVVEPPLFGLGQFGLLVGLLSGFVVGLAHGAAEVSPQGVGPRDVIRADDQYGLATGLICGSIISLAVGFEVLSPGDLRWSIGLAIALAYGFTVALGFGLSWIGAGVWVRYHIAVVITAIHRSGPLSFGTSLDWAYQAGLLRLSGTAYQFRHRQLQDWALSGGDSTEKKVSQS